MKIQKLLLFAITNTVVLVLVSGIFVYLAFSTGDADKSFVAESFADYFHVGPGDGFVYMGYCIDSWSKWSMAMVMYAMIVVTSTLVAETIKPWISNELSNAKVPIDYRCQAHLLYQLYYFNWTVETFIATLSSLTQIDMLVMSLLISASTSAYTTEMYLREKKDMLLDSVV